MLIGVSTGVLHNYINGINKQIEFFRKSGLEIDGVEISFGSAKTIEKLTSKNEEYLKQLKFTSMHLPWLDIDYTDKETPAINTLSEIYRSLNSRLAVIHPDCIKDSKVYDFLQKYFPKLSVENMTPRKPVGYSIDHIRKITDYNKKLGVVLDFAHCMESKESFELYEKAFYDKITEIHISAANNDETDVRHVFLHKTGILPAINKRNIPLIIEGKLSTVEELKNEIDFVRRL